MSADAIGQVCRNALDDALGTDASVTEMGYR
jgi:hypothetical protein